MNFNAPADYTAETRALVEDEINRFRAAQRAGRIARQVPDALLDVPHVREAWHCGAWLEAKLLDLGCDRIRAREICYANGQRSAMAPDPWVPTLRTLEEFKAGQAPKPGPELAQRLLDGRD